MYKIRRWHSPWVFCLVAFTLGGCVTVSNPPSAERRTLYPPLTSALKQALDTAKKCDKPGVAAADKVGPDFTYGCFCGQSHPEYKHKSGTPYDELELPDRLELVENFYGDEPIDDIDAACRDHDVCWVYTGREDADCNVEFYKRLEAISDEMQIRNEAAGGRYDSTEARCAAFSDGVGQIFLTHVIDNDYDGVGEAVTSNLQRLILTPFAIGKLVVEAFRAAVLGKEVFPRDGETCRITEGRDGLYPPNNFETETSQPNQASASEYKAVRTSKNRRIAIPRK